MLAFGLTKIIFKYNAHKSTRKACFKNHRSNDFDSFKTKYLIEISLNRFEVRVFDEMSN